MRRDILTKVKKLHRAFHNGEIERLREHEVHPKLHEGSRENYLYFTLPPALNFQRSSPSLWKSALATWKDPKTNYLFFPEKVTRTSEAAVRDSLLKHKLALQRNKHTDIWRRISSTLHTFFRDNPKNLFKESGYDVGEILTLVQDKYKKNFPYLRGKKMSNYWLYIASHYTDAPFVNLEAISIIPDTHVQQSSVRLGLVKEDASPEEIADAWQRLLKDSGLIPIDMHSVLWNWSRAGFMPEV